MGVSAEQVAAGQAVYTKRTLGAYDLIVLGLSNRLIWKCPSQRLLEHYNRRHGEPFGRRDWNRLFSRPLSVSVAPAPRRVDGP